MAGVAASGLAAAAQGAGGSRWMCTWMPDEGVRLLPRVERLGAVPEGWLLRWGRLPVGRMGRMESPTDEAAR